MALLQGIIALLSRSVGSVLSSIFGWAVTALFGQTRPNEKTVLSGVVGAAAVWPILLVGIAFPHVVSFLVAFVPLSRSIPNAAVRPIWIALALIVPIAVGVTVHVRNRDRRPLWRAILQGFPITVGLAGSFLFTLVSVPILRIVSLVRRRTDAHLVVITDGDAYQRVAEGLAAAWQAQGLGLVQAAPPFWLTIPTKILTTVAGSTFARYVPARLAFFRGRDIELALYPSDLLLRGKPKVLALVQLATVESLIALPALQTTDPRTQEIERDIAKAWAIAHDSPGGGARPALRSRVGELSRELRLCEADWGDVRAVYRELLQLDRALSGQAQLLEATQQHPTAAAATEKEVGRSRASNGGSPQAASPSPPAWASPPGPPSPAPSR